MVFDFGQYTSISDIDSALSGVELMDGDCNVEEALYKCGSALFTDDAKGRQRVLIFITAGVLKGDFSNAAAVLKTTGVKIIAVGIGASVDNSQLSTIASPASSVLNVVSYTDLTEITDGVCKIVPKGIRNEKIQIPYPVLIFVTNSYLFPNLMNQLSLSQTVIDSCVFNF